MKKDEIIQLVMDKGSAGHGTVSIKDIRFYPELREMCTMNSCGKYDANWGCPPGCGEFDEIRGKLVQYGEGVLFQYIGQLEDSFDYENMSAAGHKFSRITKEIKKALNEDGGDYLVMGAGGCDLCEECTYPDAPCRFPDLRAIPMEGCGINVSEICGQAHINYINGQNTVTYTGMVAF